MDVLKSSWELANSGDILMKLQACSNDMANWSKSLDFKFKKAISDCKHQLEEARVCCEDEQGMFDFKNKKEKLISLLLQEEDYWKQRAKAFWLKDGDSNTKYFHATASSRKRMNQIEKLLNNDNVLVRSQEDLCEVTHNYLHELFQVQQAVYAPVIEAVNSIVTEEDNHHLMDKFTEEEFRCAIFQMHPDKSLGLDGLNPAFFQHFWELCGKDIFQACCSWLENGSFSFFS